MTVFSVSHTGRFPRSSDGDSDCGPPSVPLSEGLSEPCLPRGRPGSLDVQGRGAEGAPEGGVPGSGQPSGREVRAKQTVCFKRSSVFIPSGVYSGAPSALRPPFSSFCRNDALWCPGAGGQLKDVFRRALLCSTCPDGLSDAGSGTPESGQLSSCGELSCPCKHPKERSQHTPCFPRSVCADRRRRPASGPASRSAGRAPHVQPPDFYPGVPKMPSSLVSLPVHLLRFLSSRPKWRCPRRNNWRERRCRNKYFRVFFSYLVI